MGQKHTLSVESGAAIFLVLFGALVTLRWLSQVQWVTQLIPGSQEMGVATPLLYVLAGLCLYSLAAQQVQSTARSHCDLVCRSLLVIIPALILLEHLFNLDLSLDWSAFPLRQPPRPRILA